MDTLSHYLWTVPLYWQHPKRWILGLAGAVPDLLSFGPVFIMHLANGFHIGNGPPPLSSIPSWVPLAYSITHSLVLCALALGLLWLWRPTLPLLLLGWPLHILVDLPTHTTQFYPTPLLWPISDWRYSGFSWGTPWFMVADAMALVGVYAWLIWKVPRTTPSDPASD